MNPILAITRHPLFPVILAICVLIMIGVTYSPSGNVELPYVASVKWADVHAVVIIVGLAVLCRWLVRDVNEAIKRH